MSMVNTELVKKAVDIVNNYNTVYMWGTFGAPVTENTIAGKVKQYPSWYTTARQNLFRSLIGKNYFAFDCVNVIKGILWGWCGDASKLYGGAVYPTADKIKSGTVIPDISADQLINVCTDVSTNFSTIAIGEAVWLKGHIGIYIGDGKAVECTPAWTNKVQITAVGNIGPIAGLNSRSWTKHGKIPWVSYTGNDVKAWTQILNEVSANAVDWVAAVTLAIEEAEKSNIGSLQIFGYLGTLIEKIDKLKYTSELTWTEIIDKVSNKPEDWKTAINAAVGAAKADGDLGTLEIFKYLPELIVKIYNSNK